MLHMIGIGLSDPSDITVKGLRTVRDADTVLLEDYTSKLQCSVESLESFYGRGVECVGRETVEKADHILREAKEANVAFLVIGDVFAATTHHGLYLEAREEDIETDIIHNASVLTAVGATGLQLYKFGRTASLPFRNVDTPIDILRQNRECGLHTLLLLDVTDDGLMTASDAVTRLKRRNALESDDTIVSCAALGSDDQAIWVGEADSVSEAELGPTPHSLIVPGDLHFQEKEALSLWK